MRFTKMHGIGNDYVYVNAFEEKVKNPSQTAINVSDRHTAIGADGLILIMPSESADVRMRMFNADGSEGQMCGNGIRCVAKYTYDHGICKKNPLKVETLAGVKTIDLNIGAGDKVVSARVNMGEPILTPDEIPVNMDGENIVDRQIEVGGVEYRITCVSMGNPHAVVFVDDVKAVELEKIGPVFENHELFPQRMNVHFVEVQSADELTMRTWERGSGITLACGTGASAVCVAGVLTGNSSRDVNIHLPGGDLQLQWDEQSNLVYMTGPAAEVFSGTWES